MHKGGRHQIEAAGTFVDWRAEIINSSRGPRACRVSLPADFAYCDGKIEFLLTQPIGDSPHGELLLECVFLNRAASADIAPGDVTVYALIEPDR